MLDTTKCENLRAQEIINKLNNIYCAQNDPEIVDWASKCGLDVEALWDLRESKDISVQQLVEIGWFLTSFLKDSSRTNEVLLKAAELSTLECIKIYAKTINQIEDKTEVINAISTLFLMGYYKHMDQDIVDFEYESFANDIVKSALIKFFDKAFECDYDVFCERLSNLMTPFFDAGWYNCDIIGKIVAWLKEYFKGAEYISCLERLLETRLKVWGYNTQDLCSHSWENDGDLFFDLGAWYMQKESKSEQLLGMHYLIEGRGGLATIPGIEEFTTWTKALYDCGMKTDYPDPAFWEDLLAEIEYINKHNGIIFDDLVIKNCHKMLERHK